MAGFAAAVFLGLMLTSCQGTQKAEQSGYKVFCRNAEATALREVQYEPEAEGGEKLVEELLSAMEGTFNRNDYQSVFPEGLTAAVSTLMMLISRWMIQEKFCCVPQWCRR